MNQEWTNLLRSLNREHMHAIWEKAKERKLDGLKEDEKQIAMIMLDHAADFHSQFDSVDVTKEQAFGPADQINPFMHICLHLIAENQLAERNPPEVFEFYNAMLKRKCSRHDALHLIANILFPLLFQVLRMQKSFDLEGYRALLKKLKYHDPDEIAEAMEAELNDMGFFDELSKEALETITSEAAKKNLDNLIDEIAGNGPPKILRSKRGGEAVLISREDYRYFVEEMTDDFLDFDDLGEDGEQHEDERLKSQGGRGVEAQKPLPLNPNFEQVYRFRVTLEATEPLIWRLIEVPGNYTFWDLHVAIQDAMGWEHDHLHRFEMKNPVTKTFQEIGIPDLGDWEQTAAVGWRCLLSDYFSMKNRKALYLYDFGDDWRHEVKLEGISKRVEKQQYPYCLDGRCACPPEDCGGVMGYVDILNILGNPKNKRHAEIRDWVGDGFDPKLFEPDKVCFTDPRKGWDHFFGEGE